MPKTCTLQSPEEEYDRPMSIITLLLALVIVALGAALVVSLVLGHNDRLRFVASAAEDTQAIATLTAQLEASQDRVKQCVDIKQVAMKLGKHPVTMTGTLVVFAVPGL